MSLKYKKTMDWLFFRMSSRFGSPFCPILNPDLSRVHLNLDWSMTCIIFSRDIRDTAEQPEPEIGC
jgi:hypothetical protein